MVCWGSPVPNHAVHPRGTDPYMEADAPRPGRRPRLRAEQRQLQQDLQPGFPLVNNTPVNWGVAYGSRPRLPMAWITTAAVRTNERELVLGRSFSQFSPQLDRVPTGGRWDSITRLKDQRPRLFAARVAFPYSDGVEATENTPTPFGRCPTDPPDTACRSVAAGRSPYPNTADTPAIPALRAARATAPAARAGQDRPKTSRESPEW
jgi:hypothetical protein